MRVLIKDIVSFFTNRILIILTVFAVCVYVLLMGLFDLQIVRGEHFLNDDRRKTDIAELSVPAPRGEIFDKYGRPLAVNVTTYTLKLNPSASFDLERLNDNLYELILLFDKNGEKYIDELPLSADEPYTLHFANSKQEKRWRDDMQIPEKAKSPYEVFAHLREKFGIDPELANGTARKVVSLRSAIYMKRYNRSQPITLAVNVSDETMAAVEEETDKFAGIFVEPDFVRKYPGGETMSHIVGYIGKINDSDLEAYAKYGYAPGDTVGKTGLEQSMELSLGGKPGKRMAETDAATGLVLSVLDSGTEPVPGDKLFLTVDSYLQEAAYNILEDKLREIIINLLKAKPVKKSPLDVTVTDLIVSMIQANTVSLKKIWQSDDSMYSYKIKQYILSVMPDADIMEKETADAARDLLADAVVKNNISLTQILLVMTEQGLITADETLLTKIRNNGISPLDLVLQKLEEGEITPQMTNLDPSTGSVVVLDVTTGETVLAVSYPTYDNNEMITNFSEYFPVVNADVTAPSYYRAFRERRAPGSTFKMITAVAGLEEGSITLKTRIHDDVIFTKAGVPYLKCWSPVSHGTINVIQAITVSCNCFFCETAYRLGNAKEGKTGDGINAINKYMIAFGLNERTGVEIGEAYDSRSKDAITQMQISSPEYRQYLDRLYDKNIVSRWFDGDTVATAIGQSLNNYTAASMAKYVATLASKGTRYRTRIVARQENYYGEIIKNDIPEVEGGLPDVSDSTWDAVFQGMYNAVNTKGGTGYSTFSDFPIEIGGKTGTAEENTNRNDHTAFAGFAPFDDPRIAIYVNIPFGNTSATPYAAARVAKDVLYLCLGLDRESEAPDALNVLTE